MFFKWKELRLKDLFASKGGGNYGEEEGSRKYNLPCISISDFKHKTLNQDTPIKMLRAYPDLNLLKKGTLLLEKSGGGEKTPVGRVLFVEENITANYSNFVQAITPRVDSKFLYFLLSSVHANRIHSAYIKQNTGLQNFDFGSFARDFKVKVPAEKFVQTAIANYLDHETARIDAEIKKEERRIELLEELLQATIFEAVTKGIDANAEMVDGGIEWIGKIPKGWEVVRLKEVANIQKGDIFDENWATAEGPYPYINGGMQPSYFSDKFNTPENSIAVSEGGASAGYVQYVQSKFWAGTHCYKIKPMSSATDKKYLFYVLKGFERMLMSEKTGSAMPNLQKTRFINYKTTFCKDTKQQTAIVSHLDAETSKIEAKKEISKKKISLLKELKQATIYEAVTGKLVVNETDRDNPNG